MYSAKIQSAPAGANQSCDYGDEVRTTDTYTAIEVTLLAFLESFVKIKVSFKALFESTILPVFLFFLYPLLSPEEEKKKKPGSSSSTPF